MRTITYYFKNEDTGELLKIIRASVWKTENYANKVFTYGFIHKNKKYGWVLKGYYHSDFIKRLRKITKKNLNKEKQETAMIYELRK